MNDRLNDRLTAIFVLTTCICMILFFVGFVVVMWRTT